MHIVLDKERRNSVNYAYSDMPYIPIIALAALLLVAAANLSADKTRQEEISYLLKQDCGSCHGLRMKGGLGPPLLASKLAGKPDEYLRIIIAKGSPANGMPPWEALLSDTDIDYLIHLLRTDAVVKEQQE